MGLVIKYLRVITSSRLCGDNPANFAVLHTIAYNCQSSLCLVNFLGTEDLLYYLSLVHPCARPQEFLLLLLSRHPWLPLSPWWPPRHPCCCCCFWSPREAGLLQMIIQRDLPLVNHHLEWPASYKWLFAGASLLQMIIQRGQTLANNHPKGPASCKWSSGGTGPCKWSTGGTSLLQMIIRHPSHPSDLCQDPDSISGTFLERFVSVYLQLKL